MYSYDEDEKNLLRKEVTALRAKVKAQAEALLAVADFINSEYRDAQAEALEGHHLAKEARPVWASICDVIEVPDRRAAEAYQEHLNGS